MKKWLTLLLIDLAALLFGAMLSLAFAPFDVFPLAVMALAGLLILCLSASPKRAFKRGFIFGLGWFSTGVYWVFHSIHLFGNVPSFPAALITAGLIAILACFPAAVVYVTNRYFPISNTAKIVYAFPAIWTLSEWVRSWLCSGFPWLLVGYSQTHSPLKGFAPIFSVYGVTLAVALSSGLLVNALRKYREKSYKAIYFNFLALIAIWVVGGLLSFIPWTKTTGKSVAVSLVQGNIPQSIKWSADHVELSLRRYAELTNPLWQKDRLIIWPEAAIPLPLNTAADFINALDNKAQATGANLILGIPIPVLNTPDGYYNAIVTLGNTKQTYLKRRLVPFGEYTPSLPIVARAFNFMDIPMPNTMPGKIQQDVFTINGIKILPSICYEIAFPELSNTSDQDVGILLTITNDAWFGESSAQAQHLQMAAMRAIELQRPLLFVSNDGITAIINADGKVTASAPPRQVFVLNGTVEPRVGLTPWMYNGIDPLLFILLVLLFFAIQSKRKNTQPIAISSAEKLHNPQDV